jgi:integrase
MAKPPASATHDAEGKMPTGLIRRAGRYSLRRRIPLGLVQHYGGKAEVTRALGTADPKLARRLLPLRWAELDEEFDRVRAQLEEARAEAERPISQISPTHIALLNLDRFREQRDGAASQGRLAEFIREKRDTLRLLQAMLDGEAAPTRDLREIEGMRNGLRALLDGDNAFAISAARKARQDIAEAEAERVAEGDALTFDGLVDRWSKERRRVGKSLDTHKAVVRQFVELAGAIPVGKVTKRDVLTFKDKLLETGNTPANVNVKLTRLRTLLNFAFANDLITAQPANGIQVLDPDAERNKRRPFDRTALAAIFGSPIYSEDARPTQGRGAAAYWLPLLALYTGARMEELGQLRTIDVRQEAYPDADDNEQSAWFIHVTEDDEDGLKLKNAGSERVIPLHPALEELGFTRFVGEAKASGHARLFPDLRPNKYGRLTAKWGEWFSLYKRNVCGVTDKRMVFHSFRHTFKDNGRGRMEDGVQRQIMGHSSDDVADDYGTGFPLWQLVEGMRSYRVAGFNLPPPPLELRQTS